MRRTGLVEGIDAMITISRLQREALAPHLPADMRYHDVPNPVDAEPLGPKTGAPGDFVFVGRLSPEKGPGVFGEAARLAGARAVFAGDGPMRAELEARFPDYLVTRRPEALAIVEAVAEAADLPEEDAPPEDGIGYEQFCLGRLKAAGWRAHPTPASGDQGADIVATRGRIRLVVQCKRYGKPVGNAAVQEAAAARRYWEADAAAVVSNAGFTPAARKLAAATGVALLHHDALGTLAEDDLLAEA